MTIIPYQINHREYHSKEPFLEGISTKAAKNYLFELPYLNVVTVEGKDPAEFLQGQLTCDVREVNETVMRPGALCNLKGRVMALVDVLAYDGLHLVLPSDLVDETLASLARTAMVSRVTLHRNNQYKIYGLYISDKNDLIPGNINIPTDPYSVCRNESACIYSTGDNYYLLLVSRDIAESLCEPFSKHQQFPGSFEWHQLQLQRLRMEIYPQTRGLFLPHRMNLHQSVCISFDKGCYKGQEIIARTHYRAKLKHELKLFVIHTKDPLAAGMKIFSRARATEVGELIDFSSLSLPDQYLVLTSIIFEHPEELMFAF